jgi:ketosteroid isomerase-like protein
MISSTIGRQDEAQIRQLIDEQAVAMRTRDAARILASRYAAEIVKFDLAPPLQHTGPELLDVGRLQSWFAGFDGPIDYEIRDLTVCLRKLDGTWRITHEHNSTPFYMDGSFRAALDLQP